MKISPVTHFIKIPKKISHILDFFPYSIINLLVKSEFQFSKVWLSILIHYEESEGGANSNKVRFPRDPC